MLPQDRSDEDGSHVSMSGDSGSGFRGRLSVAARDGVHEGVGTPFSSLEHTGYDSHHEQEPVSAPRRWHAFERSVTVMEHASTAAIALTDSVASRALVDLMEPFAESAIDATLSDGVLKDIPIIGILLKAHDAVTAVRNHLFVRKVARFLYSLSTVEQSTRDAFLRRLAASPTERTRFGEALLLLLDRAESIEKAAVLGHLVAAQIRGDLDHSVVTRLCHMADRAYLPDLIRLKNFKDGTYNDDPGVDSLAHVGLLSFGGVDGGSAAEDSGGVIYCINQYGEMMARFGFSDGRSVDG